MKKIAARFVLIMMISVLSLSFLNPASASELELSPNKDIPDTPVYSYVYNGVEFTGGYELSQEELKNMYFETVGSSGDLNDEITTFAENDGSSSVMVTPKYYRTYKNTGAKAAAELTTIFLISKMPKPVKTSTLGIWVLGKLQGWSSSIKTTYVGSWISSSWSSYQNKRIYHATLVHYTNSNYTTPISVQYYDVSQYY